MRRGYRLFGETFKQICKVRGIDTFWLNFAVSQIKDSMSDFVLARTGGHRAPDRRNKAAR